MSGFKLNMTAFRHSSDSTAGFAELLVPPDDCFLPVDIILKYLESLDANDITNESLLFGDLTDRVKENLPMFKTTLDQLDQKIFEHIQTGQPIRDNEALAQEIERFISISLL